MINVAKTVDDMRALAIRAEGSKCIDFMSAQSNHYWPILSLVSRLLLLWSVERDWRAQDVHDSCKTFLV